MTKSTITRERIQRIIRAINSEAYDEEEIREWLSSDEIMELSRMALAAMDSEPVAYISKSDFDAGYPHILARRDFNKACTMPVYAAQPAPVGLENLRSIVADPRLLPRRKEWIGGQQYSYVLLEEVEAIVDEACRSAMLQAGNSPAQSDCCPAQNVVVPAQSPIDHGYRPECECSGCKATARICTEMAVNSLVIPNEMTSEQAYEIGYYYGDPVDVFARGANWMRQHIIDSTLAAAPQSPGSEPATVPGKWIPVSERMPESNGMYFGWDGKRVLEVYCFFGGFSANQFIHGEITHWMPLPAAPQEVR
ncbi:Protein of uncharacterised function (DUF551) [Klebsiella pneumoniae]|nr:Protein of uncharacterised function (DUF551) [Klebsiella pneumoniae]